MKRYDDAITAGEQASEKDTEKKNSAEIQRELKKAVSGKYSERANETEEETLARAMRDPEVQRIMSDPAMMRKFSSSTTVLLRSETECISLRILEILQQAQQDPSSLASHLQNPKVRDNIMKLSQAGILKMR